MRGEQRCRSGVEVVALTWHCRCQPAVISRDAPQVHAFQ